MNSTGYSISKTSFLKFEQCSKAFFLYKNHPYLRDKLSKDKQLTFKRGHDVGFFAQQLFPGGRDVSKETKSSSQAAALTLTLIQERLPVIYEATFLFNGVLIMADILCLENGKYTAYEVKSSIKISETYLKDAYLQYYVLKNSLAEFDDLYLVTLNSDYIMDTEIEAKKLFKKRSVKVKAEENFPYFDHKIKEAHLILEQNNIPNIGIGKQCFRPYQCDFFGNCWKETISEKSIFNMPFLDKGLLFEWFHTGTKNIEQLSDQLLEKDLLIRVRNSFLDQKAIVHKENILRFLSTIKQPVAAMDMEIWSPAIPQLKGTKPFEQIPFLVCVFDGEKSSSFFTENANDQRVAFAHQLIELTKNYATILVYDKTMEINAINNLLHLVPELKPEMEVLKAKMKDVFDVFLNLDYYHPGFKSNFSLKVVSSTLLPEISYSGIVSGLEAMNYYEQFRLADNELEKERIKAELISYCNTDSLATLKIVDFLQSLIK